MSVVCAACKTENRANAMFCRGCAGKLPGFAATGPAALDIMKPLRPAQAPAADAGPATTPSQGLLQLDSRAFWLRLGLLALAITVGFVGWYAYVTRRTLPPARPAVAAPFATPVRPARAPVPVPAAEALSSGETLALDAPATPPTPPTPAPLPAEVVGPRNGVNQRPPAARRREIETSASAPVRAAGVDPRPSCAHLNFIAGARCEAAQCARVEYRTHPHCDAVRDQTRRDEARRNLPN